MEPFLKIIDALYLEVLGKGLGKATPQELMEALEELSFEEREELYGLAALEVVRGIMIALPLRLQWSNRSPL